MTRRLLSSIVMLGAVVGVTSAFSCKTFDLPAETCNPSSLQTIFRESGDCGRCLEDHCCDAVGVCERMEGCAKIVSDTQFCVTALPLKGASLEQGCAVSSGLTAVVDGKLVNPEADGAYRCMRTECGAQCGLPACKVDKAALLIRNAKCDVCFAGGCCAPLNRCYENRACKLMLECVVSTCGRTLGTSLKEPGGGRPDDAPSTPEQLALLCSERPPPNIGIPECVRTCLCRYRENDQGLLPEDRSLLPMNLAEDVYECGKAANCGDDCIPGPDGGPD